MPNPKADVRWLTLRWGGFLHPTWKAEPARLKPVSVQRSVTRAGSGDAEEHHEICKPLHVTPFGIATDEIVMMPGRAV